MPAETINLHVWAKCNLHCAYCYGRFPARPPHLPASEWCRILDLIAAEGVRRVTFSGGEPTLHPGLASMLEHARRASLQTSIITNGARLTPENVSMLDLVAVTADSADARTLLRLGRGHGYLETLYRVAHLVHQRQTRLKVNTVVTALNETEDLTALIRALRPSKWKPLQFVHVPGENDDTAPALGITDEAFEAFVRRHASLKTELVFAPEPARVIRTTYVMIDPLGRLFQHSPSGHRVSASVLEVGVRAALDAVGGYDRAAFEARGGHVDVKRLPVLQGLPR
jgi:radical S-adenosyl methionine domain-containing protein 2